MIRIFPVYPNITDATSFYRGDFPLANLMHTHPVQLFPALQVDRVTMAPADVCFLQRPFLPQHVQTAQIAEKLYKPIWCDWDDDLFTVPESNPAHETYSSPDVQNNIAILAAMADAVSVTTPALAERFNDIRRRAQKPPCVVIPNALSDHFLKRRVAPDPHRRPLIFWRGSQTHREDLMTITESLRETLLRRQEFTMYFMGDNPFWMTKQLPKQKCCVSGPLDILDYHWHLQELQPSIMIVPLHDSPFNRAKSNIAWLEGVYGHAQIVAPDFEEWRRPGILNYKSPEEFSSVLEYAMDQVTQNDWGPVYEGWAHITQNCLLSQANKLRWSLLESLVQ